MSASGQTRLKCICALCLLLIWQLMTANDLTTPPLPLLVQGRPQVSFARDPSEGEDWEGGQVTSKGDGLVRSNLPLGDSLLRGAGYFVTGHSITDVQVRIQATPFFLPQKPVRPWPYRPYLCRRPCTQALGRRREKIYCSRMRVIIPC